MQAAGFKQWLARVALLSRRQREQLLVLLRPAVGLDRVCATIEEARQVSSCPGCGGRRLHRHGVDRGVQRYRCCACCKTFSALTGTPLARLRYRGKWLDYLDGMLEGQSVRKTADRLGVHRNTSFRWRHRFLHLAKEDRPAALAGIAEAAGERVRGAVHVQNVNASRYLPNYLGWQWEVDGRRIGSAEAMLRIALGRSNIGW